MKEVGFRGSFFTIPRTKFKWNSSRKKILADEHSGKNFSRTLFLPKKEQEKHEKVVLLKLLETK